MKNNDSIDMGDRERRIKRRGSFPITGSVWERRMKLDEVKGGIEVLIASTHNNDDFEIHLDNKTTTLGGTKQSPIGRVRSQRKTWKSQNSDDNPIQIAKQISCKEIKVKSELIESSPVAIKKLESDDEDCGEFGVCEDKAITSDLKEMARIETQFNDNSVDGEEIEEIDDKIGVEKKSFIATEERRNERTAPPVFNHARINKIQTKTMPNHFNGIQRTNIKLQSFVDLIMWRNVIKSAFVFGIGSFVIIISSSYTKDLSISFISAISYLCLLYLAIIFLFRSFFNRSSIDIEEEYVIGEAEAIRIVKLVLPCVNEFLLNLRALFSGDPSTTLKMAILLFILALNGSTITIWKMVKLCFFGVFIVPRFCSSYSSQLTAYGIFWTQRIGDAWDSCSHKKATVFAIFTVFWNLSSVVARIWTVFMLIVAFKHQQHSLEERDAGSHIKMENKRILVGKQNQD